jgi:5-methylcytosine-specific restriction endonuclease McrA
MSMSVLLLNVNGAPARVIDERRAWSLLERGKACIILEHPTPLRTVRGPQARPSVMYLTRFARPGEVGWSRREVLVRDSGRCAYCGGPAGTIDHVLPQWRCRAEGCPANTWENTVAACVGCQQRKGGRTLEQAGMRFRAGFRPGTPRHLRPSFLRLLRLCPEWQPFVPVGWQQTPVP